MTAPAKLDAVAYEVSLVHEDVKVVRATVERHDARFDAIDQALAKILRRLPEYGDPSIRARPCDGLEGPRGLPMPAAWLLRVFRATLGDQVAAAFTVTAARRSLDRVSNRI